MWILTLRMARTHPPALHTSSVVIVTRFGELLPSVSVDETGCDTGDESCGIAITVEAIAYWVAY
jgi:hypothetical protein